MTDFNLRAIISAVDNLSPTLRRVSRNLHGFSRQLASASRGAFVHGGLFAAGMLAPKKAFSDLEDASIQLKNTLMGANGLSPGFDQLSQMAIELGNKLPGTTADFMAMASQLKALGVSTETMVGGALKATAYLAVIGKSLGVTYHTSAEAVGKLGNAFGIAANDLIPFTDALQRTLHMDVDLLQMQYAMARASGPLKALGKQGIGVANDLIPLTALLIQAGLSGEEAGTGIKKIIEVFAMKGKFKDIPSMVKSLEKLNKLAPSEKIKAFKKLFGTEHSSKAAIIAAGGYDKLIGKMRAQADMQQRIANSMGTLTNLYEASSGSVTNLGAAIGEIYAPELKSLAININNLVPSLMQWVKEHKDLIKTFITIVGTVVSMRLALAGLSLVIGGFALTSLGAAFTALSFSIGLVLAKLDSIKWFFTASPVAESISNFANGIRNIWNAPSNASMRLPGMQSQNKLLNGAGGKVSGSVDVNFSNTPSGTRVESKTKGPVSVRPNVGYRSLGASGAY
jgi:hypothetical protein